MADEKNTTTNETEAKTAAAKPAAKTRTRKAPAKRKPAAKPKATRKAPAKAATASKPKGAPTGATFYLPTDGQPYSVLGGAVNKSAFTVGALVATGFAKVSKAGTVSASGKGGNRAALAKLIGPSAMRYHRTRIGADTLTPEGASFFHARLNGGTVHWTTTGELAMTMATAIAKGGTVEVDRNGQPAKVKFGRAVTA